MCRWAAELAFPDVVRHHVHIGSAVGLHEVLSEIEAVWPLQGNRVVEGKGLVVGEEYNEANHHGVEGIEAGGAKERVNEITKTFHN